MNITDVVERRNMIVVSTDEPGFPEFVFPKDRFDSVHKMEREILKILKKNKRVRKTRTDKVECVKQEWEGLRPKPITRG